MISPLPPAILHDPLFGVTLTVGAYAAAQALHRRYQHLNPFILTTTFLLLILWGLSSAEGGGGGMAATIEAYKIGGDLITFLLGPAVVALAIPLYKNARHIRRHIAPILAAIAVGGITAMATGALAVMLLNRIDGAGSKLAGGGAGGGALVLQAMIPKSVTTPIAVGLVAQYPNLSAEALSRLQSLVAALVVVTGIFGAIVGPRFLRRIGIRRDVPMGLALGTAAHGIGTATALRNSELQGLAAGLAMALNGVWTSALMIPLYGLFK
ncbi:MAG: LrgB family protein [Phycisphaerae bacterium]